TPLSYPGMLISLVRALSQYKPDLVHIFKPKGFAGAAGSYLMLKGMRNLAVDCDDWEGWGGWNDVKSYPWVLKEYIDRQERWMMHSAPLLTVASRELHKRCVGVRGSDASVHYVPNCMSAENLRIQAQVGECSESELRQQFGLPGGLIVLYSGHFEPGDETMFFCRAAAPVAERHRASIVFVGDGPELCQVKAFFAGRSNSSVYFLPQLPYEEFVRAVAVADVTAFPFPDDRVHQSKCSARVIDYMSMGKAVITSAVGQNSEYIVDGQSGILVPPMDDSGFSEGLDLLLRSPDLRANLGENAAKRIREDFCWSGQPLQQCLAAYQQLVGEHEPV